VTDIAKQPVCAVHVASRGPRFYRDETGAVMFKITLDARSSIGPRPATERDHHDYPAAWKAFQDGDVSAAEPTRPMMSTEDHPDAKAAHERQAAERQRKMDERRGRGP
jgi:hypothetical protein